MPRAPDGPTSAVAFSRRTASTVRTKGASAVRIKAAPAAIANALTRDTDQSRLAGQGAPLVLPVLRGGQPLQLQRLPTEPPANASAGAALVGRYRASDLAADVRITLEGQSLQMTLQADAPAVHCTLQAWAPEVFGLSVPGVPEVPLGGVLSVQREAGEVAGLYLDTFRSRRLWLERLPPDGGVTRIAP